MEPMNFCIQAMTSMTGCATVNQVYSWTIILNAWMIRSWLHIESGSFKGFVYYSKNHQCYEPFRKGPCGDSEYLILVKDSESDAECYPNPCARENFVPFANGCYELNKPGPCQHAALSSVIGVNETTLQIFCTPPSDSLFNRFEDKGVTIPADRRVWGVSYQNNFSNSRRYCLRGSRRWTLRQCPEQRMLLV